MIYFAPLKEDVVKLIMKLVKLALLVAFVWGCWAIYRAVSEREPSTATAEEKAQAREAWAAAAALDRAADKAETLRQERR